MLNKLEDFHMVAVSSCYIQGKLANALYFHALKSLLYQDLCLIRLNMLGISESLWKAHLKVVLWDSCIGTHMVQLWSCDKTNNIWHPRSGRMWRLLCFLAPPTSPVLWLASSMNSTCSLFTVPCLPLCLLLSFLYMTKYHSSFRMP